MTGDHFVGHKDTGCLKLRIFLGYPVKCLECETTFKASPLRYVDNRVVIWYSRYRNYGTYAFYKYSGYLTWYG